MQTETFLMGIEKLNAIQRVTFEMIMLNTLFYENTIRNCG